MTTPRPFTALADGLAMFRGQLVGEAGDLIASVGGQAGPMADAAKLVLTGLSEIFSGLRDGFADMIEITVLADAATALAELAIDFAAGLDAVEVDHAPPVFQPILFPLATVGDLLREPADLLAQAVDIADLMPRPEELRACMYELELILGLDPNAGGQRTLPQLVAALA